MHNLIAVDYFQLIRDSLLKLQGEPDPVIFVMDSISYLRPEVENFETVRVGDNIPFFNNFLRAVRPLIDNTNALLILINGVYQDNENKYNDYKISGGETLRRACDLITLHYKRANPSNPTAAEQHTEVISKGIEVPYRQKLGLKIIKNKWNNCESSLSKMDYFFTTDKRHGTPGLDSVNCMLTFLKLAGILTGQGTYAIGETKMKWVEWEDQARVNPDILLLITNETVKALDTIYNGV